MRRLLLELKIAGINFPLVTAALSLALVLFAALAGELLDFAPIAFEVVFPLYAAIAVGSGPASAAIPPLRPSPPKAPPGSPGCFGASSLSSPR